MVLIIRIAATVLDNTTDVKCCRFYKPNHYDKVSAAQVPRSFSRTSNSTPELNLIGLLISGAHDPRDGTFATVAEDGLGKHKAHHAGGAWWASGWGMGW